MYYHASLSAKLPKILSPNAYYESDVGGCPQPRMGDVSLGFPSSQIPEIAFSKKPVDAVFAVANNIALGIYESGNKPSKPEQVWVYVTSDEPDVDLSDCGYDFGTISEVRYRKPVSVRLRYFTTLSPEQLLQVAKLYGYEAPSDEELRSELLGMGYKKSDIETILADAKFNSDFDEPERYPDFARIESGSVPIKKAIKHSLRSSIQVD